MLSILKEIEEVEKPAEKPKEKHPKVKELKNYMDQSNIPLSSKRMKIKEMLRQASKERNYELFMNLLEEYKEHQRESKIKK